MHSARSRRAIPRATLALLPAVLTLYPTPAADAQVIAGETFNLAITAPTASGSTLTLFSGRGTFAGDLNPASGIEGAGRLDFSAVPGVQAFVFADAQFAAPDLVQFFIIVFGINSSATGFSELVPQGFRPTLSGQPQTLTGLNVSLGFPLPTPGPAGSLPDGVAFTLDPTASALSIVGGDFLPLRVGGGSLPGSGFSPAQLALLDGDQLAASASFSAGLEAGFPPGAALDTLGLGGFQLRLTLRATPIPAPAPAAALLALALAPRRRR